MVRYLDTTAITNEIEKILKKAEEYVYIVSPYLRIFNRYKLLIEDNDLRKIDTKIIYGKGDLQPGESEWINSLKKASLYYCENLHAKCYANERTLIITSMNLYEFSQINNEEMGLAVDKDEDPSLFDEIMTDVRRIMRQSKNVEVSVRTVPREETKNTDGVNGFCIRCGKNIKLDPSKPYCVDDFITWSKYSDTAYVEKNGVCHICGKTNSSSLDRPVCRDCYSKNKELFKKR